MDKLKNSTPATKMKVSLIITTYNWKEALQVSLQSVLNQSLLPHEVVVADDGSRDDTREVIENFRAMANIPVLHVWHEDKGFRVTTIRNKAIVASTGQYIVQIDGDIVLHRHFIKDHVEVARQGCFVCGSRVSLSQRVSSEVLSNGRVPGNVLVAGFGYLLNNVRSRLLRNFLAPRYGQKKVDRLRGCNMAFWKEDLFAVNGYNEFLTSWGHEDSELAFRLINAGRRKRFLKMGGIVYHLWHPLASRENESNHYDAIEQVKSSGSFWCEQGLAHHIK